MEARRCLNILGFDATIAAIPTWASLRRAYLRRLRSSHPDRTACKSDEFIQVRDAYRQLCDKCTPGTPLCCDSDVPETDSSDEEEHRESHPTRTTKLALPTIGMQKCTNKSLKGHKLLLVGGFDEVNGGLPELRRWIKDAGGRSVVQSAASATAVVISHGHGVPTAASGLCALTLTALVNSVIHGFSISDAGSYVVFDAESSNGGRGRGRPTGSGRGVGKGRRGCGRDG
eukprot:7012609-Prymnesium_polylepis.1